MLVEDIAQIALSGFTRTRQLFCEIRLASRFPRLAAGQERVRCDVGDMDAVRATRASLEEAVSKANRLWEMLGYIAQTSAI